MWDEFIKWLEVAGENTNSPSVLALLALAAGVEYVFPPFPGDTIIVLGIVFATAWEWNPMLVFASLLLGSVVGSYIAFYLGTRMRTRRTPRLSRLLDRFERHGPWYLLLNRFMPGIRPLFFVAAGMVELRTSTVMILSTLSAALWIGALMILGWTFGDNLDALEALVKTYTSVAIAVLAAFLGAALLVWYWRNRKKD